MPHRRPPAHAAGPIARGRRWLSADPAEVVAFLPRSRESAGSTTARGLLDGLLGWRRAILRHRLVAVMRRSLTIALAVAALLLLARLAFDWPGDAVLVVVPLAVLAGALVIAAAGVRSSSARGGRDDGGVLAPARVARLLDGSLALAERLGTAWELSGASEGEDLLARRVLADGDRLVWEVRDRYRVRATPAPREWTVLAVTLVAVVGLVAVGGAGASSDSGGALRASDADGGGAAAQAPGSTRTTNTSTLPRTAPSPAATAPLNGAQRGTTTVPQNGTTTPSERSGAAPPTIAVHRQQTQQAAGTRGGAATGGASPTAGARGGAAAGEGAARSSPPGQRTGAAARPGQVPSPNQVKGFSAQGRGAHSPTSSGTQAQGTQRSSARNGAARSGATGAGRQTSQIGRGQAQGESAAGDQSLPLRTLGTNGGRTAGTSAGRAGTGGRGRGAARVQDGAAGTTDAATGTAPSRLPFVPSVVNQVAPYLRSLVSAYFPQR